MGGEACGARAMGVRHGAVGWAVGVKACAARELREISTMRCILGAELGRARAMGVRHGAVGWAVGAKACGPRQMGGRHGTARCSGGEACPATVCCERLDPTGVLAAVPESCLIILGI